MNTFVRHPSYTVLFLVAVMSSRCSQPQSAEIVTPEESTLPTITDAKDLDSLRLSYTDGYITENRMPTTPPLDGDRITCRVTVIAENISTTVRIDSVRAQSAEVYLLRTGQMIGSLSFWPDGSRILMPGERDTFDVYQSTDEPYPFSAVTFEPTDSVSFLIQFGDSLGNVKTLRTPSIHYMITQ